MPGRIPRSLTLALGGVLVAAATALATAPVAAAADTATVYVVHGIPETPVDVYVDGARALDDFRPATGAGPLQLPAGPHEVEIFAADAADASGTPVLSADADLTAGSSVTLVAHLSEAGEPALTPFVNDVAKLAAGQARLVVRHTAAAPAVDVLAGGKAVISGITNPKQQALDLPAGTVPASVAAAGTTEPVIGPADLDLEEGHRDVRARDRVAAGQDARPRRRHGARAAQRPVRGALGRAVGCTVRVRDAGRAARRSRRRRGRGRPGRGPAARRRPALNRGHLPVAVLITGLTTGLVACGSPPAPAPDRVRLAGIDVDAAVVAVGVDGRGEMEVPRDVRTVGWYRFGPGPGSDAGSAVLSGHVDDRVQGRGAFHALTDVEIGDPVRVGLTDGTDVAYRVSRVERIDKSVLPWTASSPATVRPASRW